MWKLGKTAVLATFAFTISSTFALPLEKRDLDIEPSYDYSWIKRYAAIGDSFAAGIGVGDLEDASDAKACSRYTGGYPNKIQAIIQAEEYQFLACSGAVSADMIEKQVPQLQGKYDLISVSAGGNDVGFSDVLKACLFLPKSQSRCDAALKDAEEKIDKELPSNILKLLSEVGPHVGQNGAIVYTLYGQFFNLAPEPCNNQNWCLLGEPAEGSCPKVTVELRSEFNRLVEKTNQVLTKILTTWSSTSYPAHWGDYAAGLGGQFCNPDSADRFDDPSNDGLAFIRPNIGEHFFNPGEKRDILDYSWKRDLIPTPDEIMRNFHPTGLGTSMQAFTALDYVAIHKAKIDGKQKVDACEWTPPDLPKPLVITENLECKNGGNQYVHSAQFEKHIDEFCTSAANEFKHEPGVRSTIRREWNNNKPDHFGFSLVYDAGERSSPDEIKSQCVEKMYKLLNDCDVNSTFKHGGSLTIARGDNPLYEYSAYGYHNRPDPIPAEKPAKCDVWYKFFYNEFFISGGLFAGSDHGQDYLLPNLRKCGVVSEWWFEYKGSIEGDNFEWDAYGRLPIGAQQWGCVRQAIIDAGASTGFKCGGR